MVAYYHQTSKLTGIGKILEIDILEIVHEWMTKVTDLDSLYRVSCVDRDEWSQGEPRYIRNTLAWYTGVSKTFKGTIRCLRIQTRPRESFSLCLGILKTVFQAKVIALTKRARRNKMIRPSI